MNEYFISRLLNSTFGYQEKISNMGGELYVVPLSFLILTNFASYFVSGLIFKCKLNILLPITLCSMFSFCLPFSFVHLGVLLCLNIIAI